MTHAYVLWSSFHGSMDLPDVDEIAGIILDQSGAVNAAERTRNELDDARDELSVWKVP